MKKAIIGLRKRETYEELINDLNHDLITNYPDRRASEIENSNYMSQLRGGFEEMMVQNDNLLREKQKDLLLKEEAGNAKASHHELVIDQSRWRPHVPPEPAEEFHTPERPAPAPSPEPEPLRIPVGQPMAYMPNRPEIQVSETRSRGSRKARNRNQPIIVEDPVIQEVERFQIGTPKSRSGRKGRKSNLAHDVDADVEQAHAIAIDDEEMHHQRQEDLREQSIVMARMMLEAAQNTAIDDFMAPRGDKRREEGADPKPAKAKAKTTKPSDNEPAPEAAPGKTRGRPPKQPDAEPESQHEPKGPPGRPKNTPASSCTDKPPQASPKKSPGRPKKEAAPEEETKSKPKPVKKDAPKKNEQTGTAKVYYDSFDEWKRNSNKGSLIDQYNLRTKQGIGTYLATKQDMKITVKQLIEKILTFDNKNKK